MKDIVGVGIRTRDTIAAAYRVSINKISIN